MKRPIARTQPAKAWKPANCADCGARHPAFSRGGLSGPWRCSPCDRKVA